MLLSTFQHLKGISTKRELGLWRSGIVSWEDLESKENVQLSIFTNKNFFSKNSLLHSSWKAFEEEDTEFFSKRLPRREHYRIALSFPKKTLFLDIETTGLSLYYDTITMVGWSMGKSYNVYIKGDDDKTLGRALSEAKAIVTFNGTLFDLPFLRKEFKGLQLPTVHIDLRFLARRVGLYGGQKALESILGIQRPKDVRSLQGETAPLLWYKYQRGNIDALKLLISYNYADVDGMKLIFDAVIDRLTHKQQIPTCIGTTHRFSTSPSDLKWSLSTPHIMDNGIRLRPYRGKRGPIVSFKDLAVLQDMSHLRVVGIDLTGGETRASGWCRLEGCQALTRLLHTDADLIQTTLDAKPNLVSIDSPLSLPKGRITTSDDDPGRKVYGITRYCERALKKRGINVYPCLIKSMQGLTNRGIQLARAFRGFGIPVIESYPGAAQDIINIPRKRASLELLKNGLAEFGIKGDFLENEISHDELDAITSAIVGLFFWSGKFEALGSNEEEFLIIPDVDISPRTWGKRRVVGLSGPIAAGKTTIGDFLKLHGFHYGRFSLVLADILHKRGITPSRESLQHIGEEVNKNPGQRWLCQELVRRLPDDGDLVIDGLRFPEDHAFLVETFGPAFLHIHIDAPSTIRLERYISAGGTREEFFQAIARPTEANISKLSSLAHVIVPNANGLEFFLSEIRRIVEAHRGRSLVCP